MNSNRTPERATAFCAALAETCNVGKACKAINIARTTAYTWREDDPEFSGMWDRAMKVGVTALEDEAHRRAFEGNDEPVFHQGSECGSVRKYSDTLAIFLLKAHAPDKYRENSKVELSGSLDLRKLSDEEIDEELAKLGAVAGTEAPRTDFTDDGSDLV